MSQNLGTCSEIWSKMGPWMLATPSGSTFHVQFVPVPSAWGRLLGSKMLNFFLCSSLVGCGWCEFPDNPLALALQKNIWPFYKSYQSIIFWISFVTSCSTNSSKRSPSDLGEKRWCAPVLLDIPRRGNPPWDRKNREGNSFLPNGRGMIHDDCLLFAPVFSVSFPFTKKQHMWDV